MSSSRRTKALLGELGHRPVINCIGTMTSLGGSVMHPAAVEAHTAAAACFTDVNALSRAVGRRVARLCRVPAGYGAHVVTGAAAGLATALAACMTRGDAASVAALPHRGYTLPRHRVVVDGASDTRWHQTLRLPGASLVSLGDVGRPMTRAQLAAALQGGAADATPPQHPSRREGDNPAGRGGVAAVVYFEGGVAAEDGPLALDAVIAEAHACSPPVPVIVDAAAALPPRSNLWTLTERGADVVLFSGSKAIRGPQATGIMLAREDLIEAARANGCPNEETALRAAKVAKEDMVAVVAALEAFVSGGDGDEAEQHEAIVAQIADGLCGAPGLDRVWRMCPGPPDIQPNHIPRVCLDIAPLPTTQANSGGAAGGGSGFTEGSINHGNPFDIRPGIPSHTLAYRLSRGTPIIAANTHAVSGTPGGLMLNPQCLTAEQAAVVVQRIRRELEEMVAEGLCGPGSAVRSKL